MQKDVKPKDLESQIVRLSLQGLALTAISRELGVSRGGVYRVLTKAGVKGIRHEDIKTEDKIPRR